MHCEAIVERKARKALARLPAMVYDRVLGAINGLSENPRPLGSRQLRNRPGRRLRVGDYRVLHDVDDDDHPPAVVAEAWRRQRGYR